VSLQLGPNPNLQNPTNTCSIPSITQRIPHAK
jgi:hypothetical protein